MYNFHPGSTTYTCNILTTLAVLGLHIAIVNQSESELLFDNLMGVPVHINTNNAQFPSDLNNQVESKIQLLFEVGK